MLKHTSLIVAGALVLGMGISTASFAEMAFSGQPVLHVARFHHQHQQRYRQDRARSEDRQAARHP